MDQYTGLITAAAITFWIWFPLMISIFCIVILGVIVYRKSFKRKKDIENISDYKIVKEKIPTEKFDFIEEEKRKKFLKDEDRSFLEDNLEEIRERVGKKSTYYIKNFYSKKRKFNLGSAVGGVFWLGYRGMFKELFIAFFLLGIFDYITFNLGFELRTSIPIGIILGMFGNNMYFKSLQKRIKDGRGEVHWGWGILLTICISVLYVYLNIILFNLL